MKARHLAVAAVTASILVQPAPAQSPRGPAIAAFGACVATQQRRSAGALMATSPDSREEYVLARQLVERSGCIRDRMFLTLQVSEVRGTIAEALLKADPEALSRLAARPAAPASRVALAEDSAFVRDYARCLADAVPGQAVRLIGTAPQSDQERDALLDFGDILNDCMPQGRSYRIDRFGTRVHIAVRLYELAEASRPAEATPYRAR